MFVDAQQLAAESVVETGVCIVGAGAAGITLACELAAHHVDVCVVESGGFDPDPAAQSLNEGENVGLPYFPLDANRQRLFGGTTNLWAGWCRPLDALDLALRPWVPYSGWPISVHELLPYYQRAHDLCELPPCSYDPGDWEHPCDTPALQSERLIDKIYRLSPPTRFGQRYRETLARAASVQVLLHANAMELEANVDATMVTRLRVGCLSGNRFWVKARHYVLAAGGVENARLLLLSNAVQPFGVGNKHDVVGRYFMEHMHFPAATFVQAKARTPAAVLRGGRGGRLATRLALSPPIQEQEQLLNHSVMLAPLHWYDRLTHAVPRRLARRIHPLGDRLPAGFDPGVALGGQRAKRWRLHHTFEQAPNPESRVTLSRERDALGQQRVRLEWCTTPLDRRTAERAPHLIGAELERAGLGHIERAVGGDAWPPPPLQGLRGHHMGTTRMSADPRHGVVDPQCRVHGSANLFIAGSSVFPTAGAGAPTLTIVALALRLADHLKPMVR